MLLIFLASCARCFLSDVISLFGADKTDTLKKLCGRSSPPVPFRIAKALHPALFRNVELDIVQEEKRETRLRNLGLSSGFSPGDKCQVVLDEQEDHPYNAHIQSIDENNGTLLVFLEELGVKQNVPAKNVQPLPLDLSKLGDQSYFPVTNIDFLRFVKKGRRRRQHRVMPIAVVADHTASSLTPDRDRTISTNSSNSNTSSATKENANNSNILATTAIDSSDVSSLGCSPNKTDSDPVHCRLEKSGGYSFHPNATNSNSPSHHTIYGNGNVQYSPVSSYSGGAPYFTPCLSTGYWSGPVFTNYHNPSVEDTELSSVEACPVTLTFTPACLPSASAPPPSRGGYPFTQTQQPLMSNSNCDASLGGSPSNPPPPPSLAPTHLQQQQQQGGYWMPVVAVPYQQPAPGAVNLTWPLSHDNFYSKDVPHSGVEYYRMNSSGHPSNCYPPGVMYTPSASNQMNIVQHHGAAAGTAVMVDATGHHHYTSVLYSTQPELTMEGSGIPSAVCVGEGHSPSCSNSFVAPLSSSSSSSSSLFTSNNSSSSVTTKPFSTASSLSSSATTWAGRVKGKAPTNLVPSSSITVNTVCTSSEKSSSKTIPVNANGHSADVESLNNKNVAKSNEAKTSPSKEGETSITDEDDNASDEFGMDVGSDQDSGCSSEYTTNSPTTDDNPSSTVIGPTYPEDAVSGDGDHDQETTDSGLEGSYKPRGKRRYYMYGSHKLVKPIKEIPLRFQILLAETSAAKARCEGQPIYMQHQQSPQQMYDVVYYQFPDGTQSQQQPQAQLNANANCFIPGQPGTPQDGTQVMGAPYECYSVCYPTNNTLPSNLHGIPSSPVQPTPLFVPPMQQGPPPPSGAAPQLGSSPASSQNCQTIIMYPTQTSQANITNSGTTIASQQQMRPMNMPPPPFPPPTTLPPPLTDPMSTNSTPCLSPTVNPVVVSLSTNLNQSKSHATSTYAKSQVVLSVPPPCHGTAQSQANIKAPVTQITAPPPNPCMLTTNPFLQPAPQHIAMPSSSQQAISAVQPTSSSLPQHVSPTPYPGSSTSPYMYVYPSPPAGQQGPTPQVMYMVSPAYTATPAGYQQPVLVPSSCPVPVQ